MRVGVHINRFDHPAGAPALGAELAATGAAAETAGVSWLSVMDHYFQMEFNGGAEDPMLEAYTTLSFLAAHTETVRLGALVTGVTYRHPGLLAKIATTLDVLSGGRAALGIGAAWYDREHEGLGVPFRPSRSASSGWRRPCGSVCRCGTRRRTAPSRAPTTGSPRPCAYRPRSAARTPRS